MLDDTSTDGERPSSPSGDIGSASAPCPPPTMLSSVAHDNDGSASTPRDVDDGCKCESEAHDNDGSVSTPRDVDDGCKCDSGVEDGFTAYACTEHRAHVSDPEITTQFVASLYAVRNDPVLPQLLAPGILSAAGAACLLVTGWTMQEIIVQRQRPPACAAELHEHVLHARKALECTGAHLPTLLIPHSCLPAAVRMLWQARKDGMARDIQVAEDECYARDDAFQGAVDCGTTGASC